MVLKIPDCFDESLISKVSLLDECLTKGFDDFYLYLWADVLMGLKIRFRDREGLTGI